MGVEERGRPTEWIYEERGKRGRIEGMAGVSRRGLAVRSRVLEKGEKESLIEKETLPQ
jgi:hypothetical protein